MLCFILPLICPRPTLNTRFHWWHHLSVNLHTHTHTHIFIYNMHLNAVNANPGLLNHWTHSRPTEKVRFVVHSILGMYSKVSLTWLLYDENSQTRKCHVCTEVIELQICANNKTHYMKNIFALGSVNFQNSALTRGKKRRDHQDVVPPEQHQVHYIMQKFALGKVEISVTALYSQHARSGLTLC